MNYRQTVETTVWESMSPGIEYVQYHFRGGKEDLAFKITRPIFEEISLFHKESAMHTESSNPDLFDFRRSFQPLSY